MNRPDSGVWWGRAWQNRDTWPITLTFHDHRDPARAGHRVHHTHHADKDGVGDLTLLGEVLLRGLKEGA